MTRSRMKAIALQYVTTFAFSAHRADTEMSCASLTLPRNKHSGRRGSEPPLIGALISALWPDAAG